MFTVIYHRFSRPLLIHVRSRVGNREDARDIVQELFLSLWQNRETLLPDTNLAAYLYASAKYKVINYVLQGKTKEKHRLVLEAQPPVPVSMADHLLRERITSELIEKEIARLPQKMQVIFRKSRMEQLSHKEIAQQLEISDTTVKKQVANALRMLKPKLGALLSLAIAFLF